MDTPTTSPLAHVLEALASLVQGDPTLPAEDTPLGRLTRETLRNQWEQARDGLLARTRRIRVSPQGGPAPRLFRFEIDRPYKRRRAGDGAIEAASGPVRGWIHYRADLHVAPPDEPMVMILLDRDQGFFHPNCRDGLLCHGRLPPGPFPLEALLEHLYGIVSYQNVNGEEPLDAEAAEYFRSHPSAFDGLLPVEPLH